MNFPRIVEKRGSNDLIRFLIFLAFRLKRRGGQNHDDVPDFTKFAWLGLSLCKLFHAWLIENINWTQLMPIFIHNAALDSTKLSMS